MGENLALNMESKGFTVAVYNRSVPGEEGVVDRFINGRGKSKRFIGTHSIEQLVDSVKSPHIIMMMVKAGRPVDELISQLLPFLSSGDVIIDGGNSDFHDTERRVKELEKKGIYFVGTGISGGEEGALHGPSVMPGGSVEAWPLVKDILQGISAKLDDGSPCCEWIGAGGAGHFVKMVHNGIEYGDMQLISEAYSLLKNRKGLDNDAMAVVFDEWNEGELDSFLIEITANILRFRDEDGKPLLDKILDVAGQKGTGKWSAIAAMDENDPLTLITEAVYARLLSALYPERIKAARLYSGKLKVESGKLSDNAQLSTFNFQLSIEDVPPRSPRKTSSAVRRRARHRAFQSVCALEAGSLILGVRIKGSFEVGDVVIFCHGGNLFVKRIAAVGGNVVMHNGINMSVPEGSYYMLGDNADDSYDSRYWDEPFVPVTTVVAKVWLPIGSR